MLRLVLFGAAVGLVTDIVVNKIFPSKYDKYKSMIKISLVIAIIIVADKSELLP